LPESGNVRLPYVILGIVGFVVIIVVILAVGDVPVTPPSRADAWVECKHAIEHRLASTATSVEPRLASAATFPAMDSDDVRPAGHWRFSVVGYVDALNGFGATRRLPYTCTVQFEEDGAVHLCGPSH
jgi:hypothetical protein